MGLSTATVVIIVRPDCAGVVLAGIADGVSVIGCHRALVTSAPTVSKARILPVISTGHRNAWVRTCDGVSQPRVCRGLVLREWAAASSSPAVRAAMSVPLGKY